MKKIIIFFMFFLLTGCWNYRELNEMAIVGSVGIDYNEEKNLFDVSVQIFNAKKSSNNSTASDSLKSPVTFYTSSSKTVHDALRSITTESPKKLYIGHLQLIVFGQNLVEKHFTEALDFFFRDAESRKDFNVFMAKNSLASDVLKILTPLETTPSASLSQTLMTNSYYKGNASQSSFDKIMAFYYNEGKEIVLPVIEIIGDKSKGEKEEDIIGTNQNVILIINHNGVFKDGKFVGFLSPEETMGYNFIAGEIKQTIIQFPCDSEGNYAAVEIVKIKSGKKLKVENDITADIKISGLGTLSEINCKIDITKEENILKLEEELNKKVESIVHETLNTVQLKFNSDIFGFGNDIFSNQYKKWQKIKNDWDNIFPNVKSNIKSNIKVKGKGSITNSTREG